MKRIAILILFLLIPTSACSVFELFKSADPEKVEALVTEVNRRSGIEAAGYVRARVHEVKRSPIGWVVTGRLLEAAWHSEPDNPYLYYGVAYWHSVGGNHQESNEILRGLIRAHPDIPYVRLSLGYNHMQEESTWVEAAAFLEEEAELFGEASPDLAFRVHNNLGIVYDDLKEYEKAILNYEKAMEVNPNHPYGYQNIGNTYRKLEDYEKAIAYGQKAIELNSYPAAHQSLGLSYLAAKDYERAVEQLEIAVDQIPGFTSAWHGLGNAYRYMGQYPQAQEAYQECLDTQSDYAACWLGLGWVSKELGDYESAIEHLSQGVQYLPHDSPERAQIEESLLMARNYMGQ